MAKRTIILSIALSFYVSTFGMAAIIDHMSVTGLDSVSQGVMDLAGVQKWLFTHASVGGNMVGGMDGLHSSNPTRYKLDTTGVGYNSGEMRANDPPAPTVNGTIYECSRGNPGWDDKITIFENSVNTSGWHDNKIDLAMDKMCYIDQGANATSYTNAMSALETAYPSTKFVYITMPLMTGSDSDNVLRNQYSQAVRSYCASNNKLLFDIADMEAYDPSGNHQTFIFGGQTYEKLYSGYTGDGGHLNTLGQQQVAKGWYATAVYATRFVPFSQSWIGGVSGHTNKWDTAGNWLLDSGSPIVPDAPGIKLIFGKSGSNATADLGTIGRIVGGIELQDAVQTTITGSATLTLDNNGASSQINVSGNHDINASVFFKDNLDIGGGGTLDFGGGLTGEASKTLTINSGTSVNLNGSAENIANSITVNGLLTSGRMDVPTLTIGVGGKVVIRPISSGQSLSDMQLKPVPEPGVFAMLFLASMLIRLWKKR